MHTLFYSRSAQEWNEALPVGNGRLGAMLFGGIARERIHLNEESIWSGLWRDRNNPAASDCLSGLRVLIDEGKVNKAEQLSLDALSGIPPQQRAYQSAGELILDFYPPLSKEALNADASPREEACTHYRRELDLYTGIHTVSFCKDSVTWKRECFISAPEDLLIIRLSSDKKTPISCKCRLDHGIYFDRLAEIAVSEPGCSGIHMYRDTDIAFTTTLFVHAKGKASSIQARGGAIQLYNADEVLLLLDIQSAYRIASEREREQYALSKIHNVLAMKWDYLVERHIEDNKKYMNRSSLHIYGNDDPSDMQSLSTDERLDKCRNTDTFADPQLIELYWNFCRYVLQASSRPGTLAATLQGIWNPYMDPPWGSRYTININTQMNYWPAAMCNLAECEEPLFKLLEDTYKHGRNTAHSMYNCRGFVAHHNLDIWGDTAPQDMWLPASSWVLGAAWLCTHIREHYEYTLDLNFLDKHFYLLREACLFFQDYLVPENACNEQGQSYLIINPSVSPENSYILDNGECGTLCAGCAMDNQILRHLFSATILSARDLGLEQTEPDYINELQTIISRLAPPVIHTNGTICEWNKEYQEVDPGHRHCSQLYALYPGNEISVQDTPELAEAAEKTLLQRLTYGGGHTGWSRAWIINFYAALHKGNQALYHLELLIKQSTMPNLFDSHPPFQIDGNFGALAGITRMLVQSKLPSSKIPEIQLLPALPDAWQSGTIRGIRVKGKLLVDMDWENGCVKKVSISRYKDSAEACIINKPGGKQYMTRSEMQIIA